MDKQPASEVTAETICAKCGNPKRLHGPKPDGNVDDGFGGETWYHWHPFSPVTTPADERPACERCETLGEALSAVRELLVGLQKEVGYLPEQRGYSTTMTKPELAVYEAIKNIDIILNRVPLSAPTPLRVWETQRREPNRSLPTGNLNTV